MCVVRGHGVELKADRAPEAPLRTHGGGRRHIPGPGYVRHQARGH